MEGMRGRLLTLLLLLGVTAGCHDTRRSEAVLALVKLHPDQPANCVALEVFTPEGTSLHSERIIRPRQQQELRIALFRDQLPEQVDIQAHALWSTGCTDPQQSAWRNGSSPRVRAHFVNTPGTVEVALGLPEQDADSDGFADKSAEGADCQDDRSDRNPAAQEVCDAIEDRDCDGLRGCDDPTCPTAGCIAVPSKIVFTEWKDQTAIGACTGPFTVTRQDAQGRASTIDQELPVGLVGADVAFYSDSRCATAPVSSVLLAKGAGSVQFHVLGQVESTLDITASTSLGTASRPLQVVTGPAVKLAFVTPLQTVSAGSCSGPFTLQRQNAQSQIVTGEPDLDISLFGPPSGQLEFFADNTCQQAAAITSVRIPQGQGSATFRVKGTQVGKFMLTASSTLPSVQQELTLVAGVPRSVKFGLSSQTVLASGCSGVVEVSTQDEHGNTVLSSAQVNLTSTRPVTFYSDATCQTAFSFPRNLPADSGVLKFYFRGTTPGVTTFTANVQNLVQAQQDHTVRAQVTTGQCQLSDAEPGATLVQCPISPPLLHKDRTFLVFQATSAGDGPGNAFVRCQLDSVSSILCDRNAPGPVVDIQWQTAEFASGVRVRHLLSEGCTGNTTSITLAPPVNLSETFLLTSFSQDGLHVDSNDAFTVRLAAADRVDITSDAGCSMPKRALQVVEFPGAQVDRGTTSMPSGNNSRDVSNLPTDVDLNRSILLHTFRTSTGDTRICNQLLRGLLVDTDDLRFIRGESNNSCDDVVLTEIAWERVQFPSGYTVQTKNVFMSDGEASGKAGVTAVDPNRTLVFSGGQAFNGQGGGDTTFFSTTLPTDIVGAGIGRHRLITSNTELEVVRGHPVSNAAFTAYVLQFPAP
jgi:hypothetical protein